MKEEENFDDYYLEDLIVEEDHDDARDVEWRQWRIDDEIGVVKTAIGRYATLRVVQTEDNWQTDGHRNGPHETDGQPDPFVVLVTGVLDGLSDGNVPVLNNSSYH